MIRPNLAMDAPPEALTIGGAEVPVDVDYRTWLRALPLLERLPDAEAYEEIEALLFGGPLPYPPDDVIAAVAGFLEGYPCTGEAPRLMGMDLNMILLRIRDRSGLDLSYRREAPFHWWLFLLEVRAL